MAPPTPLPEKEAVRLAVLKNYNILDTPPEKAFDDIVTLASTICDTPIALVSLIDKSRQWFKACLGLCSQETSRDIAFCAYAIVDPTKIFEIPDAHEDPRFCNNPLVTGEPYVRFYAGAPLVTGIGSGARDALRDRHGAERTFGQAAHGAGSPCPPGGRASGIASSEGGARRQRGSLPCRSFRAARGNGSAKSSRRDHPVQCAGRSPF